MEIKVNFSPFNSVKTAVAAVLLGAVPLCFISTAHGATHNEVQVLAVDAEGADDNLIGAQYIRYLDAVQSNTGAYLINPYLQRVSSLSGGYYTVDDLDVFTLGSTFYLNQEWMIDIQGLHTQSDSMYGDIENTSVDFKVGFNLIPQWQIGAGLIYQRASYDFNDGVDIFKERYKETSAMAFTRYTTVNKMGTGWDFTAEYIAYDADTLSATARYFFSPGFSLAGTYTFVKGMEDLDNDNSAGIELDYWFNEQFSIKASFEKDLDNDDGSDIASLTASYRF